MLELRCECLDPESNQGHGDFQSSCGGGQGRGIRRFGGGEDPGCNAFVTAGPGEAVRLHEW